MGLTAAASGTAGGPVESTVKLNTKRHVRAGNTVVISGRVTPAAARDVVITVGGQKLEARSEQDGRFSARWGATGAGVYKARASVDGAGLATEARSPAKRINVYRPAAASYYGPGLYGGALACGGTLRSGTVGVANKSLPCGTRLTLRYGSRSVRVQVIDRGPYSGNREFDLTAATRARLGFPSTGTVLTTR